MARFEGRDVMRAEHIGTGTSKEPRYAIRIDFAFDEGNQKVLIGYIGQHQRTDAT